MPRTIIFESYDNSIFVFWRNQKHFPQELHHFTFPPAKDEGVISYMLIDTYYFPFQKTRAILQVWSSVSLQFFSLQFWFSLPWWLGMLSLFSCICCSFLHTLWRNSYSSLGPFFNWVVCLLVLSFGSSYKLCILNPYQKKNDLQVFSPIL